MNSKIKNAFSEIHADENLKNLTFGNVVNTKAKKKIPTAYKLVPIMAVFVAIIFGTVYFTPVSYISIDINPSIELSVNRFDRVIDVTASNEDAMNIVNSINLENLSYVDALEALSEADNFSQFNDSYTEITVISKNSNDIIDNIKSCNFNNQNISFHTSNMEIKDKALENDVSFGKYRAYLELLEINPDVKIEDIRNLPMRAIRDMIENEGVVGEDTENPYGNEHVNSNGNTQGQGNSQNQGNGNKK